MTQEQKRIKIAEACGITVRPDLSGFCNDHNGCADWTIIPDYFNDLNAMQEAEKVLSNHTLGIVRSELSGYRLMLFDMCGENLSCIHATADQRAEAFGKTLNLW